MLIRKPKVAKKHKHDLYILSHYLLTLTQIIYYLKFDIKLVNILLILR